jgi:dTDP-4-dehydrorhamnose reductase
LLTCDFDSSADRRSDFTNPSAVADLVERIRPDVIVNAAAHTLVDKAEAEAERARLINAETVGVVAEQTQKHRALLFHYSTDYVFDGRGTSRRDELAPTGPLSVYGITKLERVFSLGLPQWQIGVERVLCEICIR